MGIKSILVITNKSDITTDLVIQRLQERNISYLRFNTEDFPTKYISQISLQEENYRSFIETTNCTYFLNDFYSVWYRRPKLADFTSYNLNKGDEIFAVREINAFLFNLYTQLFEARWINDPYSLYKTERKAFQLSTAKQIGFNIPDTLFTNNHKEFRKFLIEHKQKVIAKPISHGGYGTDDSFAIFTIDLEDKNFNDTEDIIKLSPFILQAKIDKRADVRVTVFGEKIFAHKIIPYAENDIDWRTHHPNKIDYYQIEVPSMVRKGIIQFLYQLNLSYGAFDFIIDKNNKWYFIEVNPNGQFAWLELAVGGQLIDSLIDLLWTPQ